ncbi:MAG: hypothetical protein PHT07_08750 [Paludibacter sp.]|nr:hypothetical protein [Paludibacter sp.]
MEKLVTIRTFSSSKDYQLVKSYLESCGIECYGMDENNNRAYINIPDGGVKLEVRSGQAEEAVKLLLDGGYLKAEDFEPTPEIKWVEKLLNHFKHKE